MLRAGPYKVLSSMLRAVHACGQLQAGAFSNRRGRGGTGDNKAGWVAPHRPALALWPPSRHQAATLWWQPLQLQLVQVMQQPVVSTMVAERTCHFRSWSCSQSPCI